MFVFPKTLFSMIKIHNLKKTSINSLYFSSLFIRDYKFFSRFLDKNNYLEKCFRNSVENFFIFKKIKKKCKRCMFIFQNLLRLKIWNHLVAN